MKLQICKNLISQVSHFHACYVFLTKHKYTKDLGFKLEIRSTSLVLFSFLSLSIWAIPRLPWATTSGDFSPNLYPHDLTLSNPSTLTNWQSLYGRTLSFSSYWIGKASLSVSFFAPPLQSLEVWSGFVFPFGCCLF